MFILPSFRYNLYSCMVVVVDVGRGGQDQSVLGCGHNKGDKGGGVRDGQEFVEGDGECGVQEEVIDEEDKCQDNLGG